MILKAKTMLDNWPDLEGHWTQDKAWATPKGNVGNWMQDKAWAIPPKVMLETGRKIRCELFPKDNVKIMYDAW